RLAVGAQKRNEPRARRLDISRVVHDDIEPTPARSSQESGQSLDAALLVPTHLREVLIEHADSTLREPDQLVGRRDLLRDRRERDGAWLGPGFRQTVIRGGGSHRDTNGVGASWLRVRSLRAAARACSRGGAAWSRHLQTGGAH